MNSDERTSPRAVLTLDDETISKIPRRLPIILLVVFVITTLVLLGTTVFFAVTKPNADIICLTEQCLKTASVITNTMNTEHDPCNNFFEYACDGWNRKQVIPGDRVEASKFGELTADLNAKLKELIERDPQANEPTSYRQVRSFYQSCIDSATINAKGAKPLKDVLGALGGWPVLGNQPGGYWAPSRFNFEKLWAALRSRYNVNVIISTSVVVNFTNSKENIIEVSLPEFTVPLQFRQKRQGRLSALIPDPIPADYGRKLLLTEELAEKRRAYKQYMIDIAIAMGSDPLDAKEQMTNVVEFETTMADKAEAAVRLHDDISTPSLGSFAAGQDGIDWLQFFSLAIPASVSPPVGNQDHILNLFPSYVSDINRWIGTESSRVKANYLLWQLVSRMVPYLGGTFLEIYQSYINTIFGTTSVPTRWKDCINQANTMIPFATGKMYVDEHFAVDTKTKTEEMVADLKAALKEMIITDSWLARSDKPLAQDKLSAMGVFVGFPDWLKNNSQVDDKSASLEILENEYFANGLHYLKWLATTELGRLRLPVDKSMWADTGPSVVNAFYDTRKNGIVIPAAILQPPFYHPNQPWYSNYGGIGVVLGHEITHGFDSTGRLFDKYGNFRNWWSISSSLNYNTKAQCIVDQYSGYIVPENNKHLDGHATEAENIADNGGLREAYKAFKANPPAHQISLPNLQHFTDDQLFFLSFSQVWCNVVTPKGADLLVEGGTHSLGRYRVIGTLQNNEDFNNAFNCPSRSYMNPTHKCKVWY